MDSNEVQIDKHIVAAKKPQGTWRGLNSIKKKERGKKSAGLNFKFTYARRMQGMIMNIRPIEGASTTLYHFLTRIAGKITNIQNEEVIFSTENGKQKEVDNKGWFGDRIRIWKPSNIRILCEWRDSSKAQLTWFDIM